jgi:hypothetical protein
LRGAAQPLPHDRDPERQSDLFRGQQGPPMDDDRGGLADHRHAALTRGDIGGPKRMKTGRCVRCPRANGAPLLGSRLMGKDSGGQWRLRTAKPPYRRRSRPECTIGPDPRQFASSRAAIEEPHMAGASELVTARRLLCPHRPTFRERTRTRSRICGWTPFRVFLPKGERAYCGRQNQWDDQHVAQSPTSRLEGVADRLPCRAATSEMLHPKTRN